jgi:hypothetical protein
MQKINGIPTAAMSNDALDAIMAKGRGRDRNKANRELVARAKRLAAVSVLRGPLDFDCPHCGAKAGDPCTTVNGSVAKTYHAKRVALAD